MRNKKVIFGELTYYIIGIVIVVLLKKYYSTASTEMLKWIIMPTSKFVSFITGLEFIEASNLGYINVDEHIAINASCAGMNFLILIFGTYYFLYLHKIKKWQQKYMWLVICMLLAYVSTIGVNGIRIIFSIYIKNADIYNGWITYERVHRILGTSIYVCSILIIYYTVGGFYNKRFKKESKLFYPLIGYIFLTVGIPLLNRTNGSSKLQIFEHSMTIIVVCIISIFLVLFIKGIVRKLIMSHKLLGNTD